VAESEPPRPASPQRKIPVVSQWGQLRRPTRGQRRHKAVGLGGLRVGEAVEVEEHNDIEVEEQHNNDGPRAMQGGACTTAPGRGGAYDTRRPRWCGRADRWHEGRQHGGAGQQWCGPFSASIHRRAMDPEIHLTGGCDGASDFLRGSRPFQIDGMNLI
jgi:hypothetical protein